MTDIDFGEAYDPTELDSGKSGPKAGNYQVVVQECSPNDESDDKSMFVKMEVVAGMDTELGKEHFDWIARSGSASRRAILFAKAVGLVTDEELAAAKAGGKISIDFEKSVGRSLFVVIEDDEYEGKVRQKIAFGYFGMADQGCKDWKRNAGVPSGNGDSSSGSSASAEDEFAGID